MINNKIRFIYFVGVDGSGKSTYAEKMYHELKKEGKNVSYLWLRMNYMFSKPFLLLARIIGATKRLTIKNKTFSVHQFYKHRWLGKIIQLTHTFDTFLMFLLKIWIPLKFSNKIIICDRFIFDVFADYAIENRDVNILNNPLFKLSLCMLPKNGKIFLIDTPKSLIEQRRPDVAEYDPDFHLRFDCYEIIKKNNNITTIDNSSTIDSTYQNIKNQLTVYV
ncbi:MAG: hypothetical protein JXB17_11945 [Bacteroidales bacterium]|nr:hypothetical protein [Bacteroidales bacterium]